MQKSKHDLSDKIWSHLSVVSMDVEIEARNLSVKHWNHVSLVSKEHVLTSN